MVDQAHACGGLVRKQLSDDFGPDTSGRVGSGRVGRVEGGGRFRHDSRAIHCATSPQSVVASQSAASSVAPAPKPVRPLRPRRRRPRPLYALCAPSLIALRLPLLLAADANIFFAPLIVHALPPFFFFALTSPCSPSAAACVLASASPPVPRRTHHLCIAPFLATTASAQQESLHHEHDLRNYGN